MIYRYLCNRLQKELCSGCSAVGSAHVWGARGRQFESGHPDKNKAKGLIINPFCFVGGKMVGEKSAKNIIINQ